MKSPRSTDNLQLRLFVLVVLAFLPALVLFWYGNRELRESRIANREEDLLRAAELLSSDYQRILDDSRTLLTALARFPQVRAGDGTECTRLLADVLADTETYTTLSVIGTDGYLRCGSLMADGDLYLGDRNYFVQATTLNRYSVGSFAIGRITGRPTLGVALPLGDAAGRPDGVLAASIDLERMSERAGLQLPSQAQLSVLDRNGVVMVRYPGPADLVGVRAEAGFPSLPAGERASIRRGEDLTGFGSTFAVASLRSGGGQPEGYLVVGVPTALLVGDAARIGGNEFRFLALAGLALLALAWMFGHYGLARRTPATA